MSGGPGFCGDRWLAVSMENVEVGQYLAYDGLGECG